MIVVSTAVQATLAQALRITAGSWDRELQRAARSPEQALERIGYRLERLKAVGFNPDNGLLVSACSLVGANPVLVAQQLSRELCTSVADALVAGPHQHAPVRVIQAVEQTWPRIIDRLARELVHEGAQARRRSGS